MKGIFKGFRYFTHMFEEQKEPEIQIGAPTDVKHVAHIGWDGPSSSAESPSWMKEFKPSGEYNAPAPPPNTSRSAAGNKSTRDVPRSSRQSTQDIYSPSPSRETTTKSKHSKSKHSKSVFDPDQSPPIIPTSEGPVKKSRRKKSKESINVGPSKSTRSKPTSSKDNTTTNPFSDSGSPVVVLGSNKGNMR